jgi:group I intron endonuclease
MTMRSYIYIIENKASGMLYVGKANDVERRWRRHKQDSSDDPRSYFHRAIRKYGPDNFEVKVVDESDDENYVLKVLEPLWIKQLKDEGYVLYNMTDGGDGIPGLIHSEETKRKMSDSLRGKIRSDETRQKLREANLGKMHSDETRKKVSEAIKGKKKPPRTEEHCKKLSEAAQARGPMSDEQREKITAGMKASDRVGHPIDEETRAKIAEKLRGQVQSEETKARRAESMRKAWERRRLLSQGESAALLSSGHGEALLTE